MLAGEDPARGDNPFVSSGEIADQNVEMHQRARLAPGCGTGTLERQPLTMRGRLKRDPARIPLDRLPAEQAGPEASQALRIRTVQHDLAYPADRPIVSIAHLPMMNDSFGVDV
jgi:hypothetical protein